MNKATYLEKFAATKITDDMTVGAAKVAEKNRKALVRFWEKTARAHVEKTEGIDFDAITVHWRNVVTKADAKPTGTVTIEVYAADQFQPDKLEKTYRVNKNDLYT
jgi:hypothetical protein